MPSSLLDSQFAALEEPGPDERPVTVTIDADPDTVVQNVFDRRYIGSVAVNAAGASIAATKFYEPAPGRTWYIGLSAATAPW